MLKVTKYVVVVNFACDRLTTVLLSLNIRHHQSQHTSWWHTSLSHFSLILYFCIRGIALNWLQSFVSDRKQYVTVDLSANWMSGVPVPLGSVFGALPFVMYISPVTNVVAAYCL